MEATMNAIVRKFPTTYHDIHAHSILASTFSHPDEVLANEILTNAEKRCVLAAWASDAFAVEAKPWLRQLPDNDTPIALTDIMQALQRLDEDDRPPPDRGGAAQRPIQFEELPAAVGF
jgi:hypothetical protein